MGYVRLEMQGLPHARSPLAALLVGIRGFDQPFWPSVS